MQQHLAPSGHTPLQPGRHATQASKQSAQVVIVWALGNWLEGRELQGSKLGCTATVVCRKLPYCTSAPAVQPHHNHMGAALPPQTAPAGERTTHSDNPSTCTPRRLSSRTTKLELSGFNRSEITWDGCRGQAAGGFGAGGVGKDEGATAPCTQPARSQPSKALPTVIPLCCSPSASPASGQYNPAHGLPCSLSNPPGHACSQSPGLHCKPLLGSSERSTNKQAS